MLTIGKFILFFYPDNKLKNELINLANFISNLLNTFTC